MRLMGILSASRACFSQRPKRKVQRNFMAIYLRFWLLALFLFSHNHVFAGRVYYLNGTDTGVDSVAETATGFDAHVVRYNNGTVQSYDNSLVVENQPTGLVDIIQVAAGGNFALALKRDGTVVGWGGRPAREGQSRPV